jgi:hypothetical protein
VAAIETLSQNDFLRTLPGVTIPHLPPEFQSIQVRQPWRWLLQLHYGDPSLHFEVSHISRLNGWELGFHCESRDHDLNLLLLRGFESHLVEIKHTLGDQLEAEMWDKGWTKIYEVYPGGRTTIDYQKAVGRRLAQIICCLQPIFVDLRLLRK